ncbi:MAG: elongation factor G [Chloroflexota bacterium]|nr:elongation factor G [Chloroflexota bacterium]
MPSIDARDIRNVVLLSHSGAGKTSLSEALLFNSNVITRQGTVEDGNTVSDYEPEEVKRGGSIQTTLIAYVCDESKINFLDTPGYEDFIGEMVSATKVVESAAILVTAQSGVDVGTERAWDLSDANGLPRCIVINKMDRENADFAQTVNTIQSSFGNKCVPFQFPIGSEQSFSAVLDVISPPGTIPSDLQPEFDGFRDRLVEAIAESDDDLADKYLEGEELSQDEILRGAREAIRKGDLVPILTTSATKNIGIKELAEFIQEFMPSPINGIRPTVSDESGNKLSIEVDSGAPVAGLVFKTTADPFVGKLSVFRVYQGTIISNSEIWNSERKQSERVGQLYLPRGKSQENVSAVSAGDMGAVGKLSSTVTGDTLCVKESPMVFDRVQFPVGFYSVAVAPATKADLDKMSTSLTRIVEEDPTLHLSRQPDTGEMVLTGFGEAQIDVTVDKIKRKFGAELITRLPRVPYRETITRTAQSEYRHKKQSGGHGQYGHVLLRLEPRDRDEGFAFGSEIVGGKVPREYIPAVEKGVMKTMEEGVVAGFPVVDVKAVIYDGSYHDVDSSGMAFEIAGSQALRSGMLDASPILLEPIARLTINAPEAYTGDVMSDLNVKRGRILGMNPQDKYTVIEAEVPHSEVQRYAQDLRSLTQGRGTYSLEIDHYEPVPQNIERKVIEDAKRAKEEASA